MDTQLDAEFKAKILVEALPFIQKYYGQTVVVKYGGNAMINEELKDAVIHDLVLLNLVGVKVVVVHGGGPEITDMLKKIGKESKFVNGLRYTDRETMTSCRWCCAARSTRIWSPCWKRRAAAASVWAAWTAACFRPGA